MRRLSLFNRVVVLALLGACDSPSAGAESSIEGTWAYTLTSYKNYTAGGIPCTASGITLVLEYHKSRQWANVGGTATGGTIACIHEGKTTTDSVLGGNAWGMIRGDSVHLQFRLGPGVSHSGFLSDGIIRGDRITGVANDFVLTVSLGDTIGGGVGTFTATRVRR